MGKPTTLGSMPCQIGDGAMGVGRKPYPYSPP